MRRKNDVSTLRYARSFERLQLRTSGFKFREDDYDVYDLCFLRVKFLGRHFRSTNHCLIDKSLAKRTCVEAKFLFVLFVLRLVLFSVISRRRQLFLGITSTLGSLCVLLKDTTR